MGAQNVAQFQSTSEQSVTELHKEYKCYSIYIVSSIAVYNKHYYMQELVLLYKASRTRVDRIGGENVCECWIFTSGLNCREKNSRVNAYTQKPGVISMKVRQVNLPYAFLGNMHDGS